MNSYKLPSVVADAVNFFGVNTPYYYPFLAAAKVKSRSGNDVILAFSIATKISILTNNSFTTEVIKCLFRRETQLTVSGEAVKSLLWSAKHPNGQTSGLCVLDYDIAELVRFDPAKDIEISECILNDVDCLCFAQGRKALIVKKVV